MPLQILWWRVLYRMISRSWWHRFVLFLIRKGLKMPRVKPKLVAWRVYNLLLCKTTLWQRQHITTPQSPCRPCLDEDASSVNRQSLFSGEMCEDDSSMSDEASLRLRPLCAGKTRDNTINVFSLDQLGSSNIYIITRTSNTKLPLWQRQQAEQRHLTAGLASAKITTLSVIAWLFSRGRDLLPGVKFV
jgi:hypothetical protein